ncbi:hypothetical protein IFR04_008548 [Cadophora malorum]|uniref:Uncharacterized protein n=1 Tax=Cadophora malorum TaxID=108018 RepID=A0A8H7TB57_9HELO|nr:hypothetical protein IFR04_008548 [Cadophora malorum]
MTESGSTKYRRGSLASVGLDNPEIVAGVSSPEVKPPDSNLTGSQTPLATCQTQ